MHKAIKAYHISVNITAFNREIPFFLSAAFEVFGRNIPLFVKTNIIPGKNDLFAAHKAIIGAFYFFSLK